MSVLDELRIPIVQAPMAGGPSTPDLAAAVNSAGGLGYLAAGYLGVDRLDADIATLRQLSAAPFGVNMFVAPTQPAHPHAVAAYAATLRSEAEHAGVELGVPRFDDDSFEQKVDLLCARPVPVVSFTFGLPPRHVIDRLAGVGSEVWLTVTTPDEAVAAAALGAHALIVQGVEAGGHRGSHVDDDKSDDLTLLAALQLIRAHIDSPLVAAGGLVTGSAIAAVLVAGAAAAQLGTAYLRCPEAGTSVAQRDATATTTSTVLTRAFSGRLARGIRNRFHDDHNSAAPSAYPEVNHVTAPLRAYGRNHNEPDLINLWAGQTHQLATDEPAATLTRRLADDAAQALEQTIQRWR